MVNEQLQFLSGKILLSPLLLKGSFATYSVLGWQFFSFSALSILSHYLLACKVSTEKSQNLMGDPIHEVAFSCCFYNSLSWVFDSLITILLGVNFFGFL